jgi:hypothetical protein
MRRTSQRYGWHKRWEFVAPKDVQTIHFSKILWDKQFDSCSQLMIACQQKNGCHKLIQHLVRQNDVEAVAAILRSTVPPFGGGNKASELTKHGKPSITGLEAPKSKPPLQSQ